METLSFRVATLNTGLVRVEFLGVDVREAIPARLQRRDALLEHLKTADQDLICLQEVYSRAQQRWLSRQLQGSDWHVICSTDGALPGQRNNGLVTLVRKARFDIRQRTDRSFKPADWTEFLIAPKGYLALALTDRLGVLPDFWLVNVHTTYGGFKNDFAGRYANDLRAAQMRMVGQDFGRRLALVAGDFNCGPHVSETAYGVLLDEFGCTDLISHKANDVEFRTWDPSNALHQSILNRDGEIHDAHHGRIDHVFATDAMLEDFVPSHPKMIWDQPMVAADFPQPGDHVCLSDHYGLELCVNAK